MSTGRRSKRFFFNSHVLDNVVLKEETYYIKWSAGSQGGQGGVWGSPGRVGGLWGGGRGPEGSTWGSKKGVFKGFGVGGRGGPLLAYRELLGIRHNHVCVCVCVCGIRFSSGLT